MSTEHHCILKDSLTSCTVGPFINLGCLDGASESGGMVSKTSWIILSRLGYDFLNTNLSQMNLCSLHYKEYFEEWIPNDGCVCGVKCIVTSETNVSLLLAVKVLRSEGKVLPIGRPLCESCQVHYEEKYAAKPGERVMIILKKRKPQTLSIKKEEPIDVKPSFIDLVYSDPEDEYPVEKRLRPDKDLIAKEEGSTTDNSSQIESKYICKLCKITFFKKSSYKLHKKTSLELHNRIKLRIRSQNQFEENDDGWKCMDCYIAFKDSITMQKHMAEVHFTAHHPFHCKSCNYIFKNQSAFKSHNSRMHVSRIDKVYYCRECDDTFACKLKHARHILIHRPWNGDPDALQCKACGKVFTKHQTTSYNKHITYHNQSEFTEDCSCYDCSVDEEEDSLAEEEDVDNEDSPLCEEDSEEEVEGSSSNKSVGVSPEDLSKPFQCSICPIKFRSPKELEEHVGNGVHEEYSVNGQSELNIKTEECSLNEKKEPLDLLLPKKEENMDPYRFMEDSKSNVKRNNPLPVSDLLEKMKLSFQSQSYVEEEDSEETCDEEDDEETVNKNFLSTEVYDRVYRGLPYAAYIKNRNMKTLLRRINTIAHTKDKSSLKSIPRSNSSTVSDDDDDDIYSGSDLDEDSDNEEELQNLLIPMENGWVCEKKWEEDQNQYSTFFWSPDGVQHSSLAIIRFYGEKKNLNLNMDLFTRAVENNPPAPPS
ncbi:uncharacterized protein [Lepeophtheirus salmonis]|uniref:uncharacterized protein n=1 Tax=Lepeophtheirus salmonis TaxID=72036 RepID=UPI001AE9E981|nr:uncharacterized protein LOC121126100 [Lepeophtheirus salmonis]